MWSVPYDALHIFKSSVETLIWGPRLSPHLNSLILRQDHLGRRDIKARMDIKVCTILAPISWPIAVAASTGAGQIKRLQHHWKCQIFDWQQWRPRAPWSTDPPQVLMLCFGKGTSNDGEDHLFYTSWNRIKTRILVSFLVASTDRSWIRNGIIVQAVTV